MQVDDEEWKLFRKWGKIRCINLVLLVGKEEEKNGHKTPNEKLRISGNSIVKLSLRTESAIPMKQFNTFLLANGYTCSPNTPLLPFMCVQGREARKKLKKKKNG